MNGLLNLTDQIGPVDIVSFLLSAALLAGLILMRWGRPRGTDLSRSGGGGRDEDARVR